MRGEHDFKKQAVFLGEMMMWTKTWTKGKFLHINIISEGALLLLGPYLALYPQSHDRQSEARL